MADGEAAVKQVTWPQVTLILGVVLIFFGAVIGLSLINDEATDIIEKSVFLLVGILGLLGLHNNSRMEQKVEQVATSVNGKIDKEKEEKRQLQERADGQILYLQDQLKQANEKIAAMALLQPPPKDNSEA
jgi:hypothetical protein